MFWTFLVFSTVFECLNTADFENEVIFDLTGLKIGLKQALISKIPKFSEISSSFRGLAQATVGIFQFWKLLWKAL